MQTFIDSKGEEWKIPTLTAGTIYDIRDEFKVNIWTAMEEGGKALLFLTQPMMLVDILSHLCQTQIVDRKLDERGFAHCLSGQTLSDAGDALFQELVLFFPRSKVAQTMGASLRVTENLDNALLAALKNSSGGSPASPEQPTP